MAPPYFWDQFKQYLSPQIEGGFGKGSRGEQLSNDLASIGPLGIGLGANALQYSSDALIGAGKYVGGKSLDAIAGIPDILSAPVNADTKVAPSAIKPVPKAASTTTPPEMLTPNPPEKDYVRSALDAHDASQGPMIFRPDQGGSAPAPTPSKPADRGPEVFVQRDKDGRVIYAGNAPGDEQYLARLGSSEDNAPRKEMGPQTMYDPGTGEMKSYQPGKGGFVSTMKPENAAYLPDSYYEEQAKRALEARARATQEDPTGLEAKRREREMEHGFNVAEIEARSQGAIAKDAARVQDLADRARGIQTELGQFLAKIDASNLPLEEKERRKEAAQQRAQEMLDLLDGRSNPTSQGL